METATIWVALVAAMAGISSAAFAFVQAKAATDALADAREARDESQIARDESVRLAAESNVAFNRQAEAQEEANRLKIQEMTPDDWAGPVHVSGDLYRLSNTSRQVLSVSSIVVQPSELANLVRFRNPKDDGIYEYGDTIEFMTIRPMGSRAEKIILNYTKPGSEDPHKWIVQL